MTGFSFDGGDLTPAEAAAAFDELPGVLQSNLVDAAEDIGLRYGRAAAEGAPADTGDLRSDLVEPLVETVGETLIEIRVGSNLPQAPPQEFGTDPGHFPPPDELRDWSRRNLGDEGAAFLVARSISETGLEAHEFLQDSFDDDNNLTFAVSKINDAVESAFSEVGLA